jgi:hypothetical protein
MAQARYAEMLRRRREGETTTTTPEVSAEDLVIPIETTGEPLPASVEETGSILPLLVGVGILAGVGVGGYYAYKKFFGKKRRR